MFNKKPGPVERRKMSNDTIPNGRMSKAQKRANFNDALSRSQRASREEMIRQRIENPPSYTDSLAVYNRNLGTSAPAWNPIADAAEGMYGKMNVSSFKPSIYKKADIKGVKKKYNLD